MNLSQAIALLQQYRLKATNARVALLQLLATGANGISFSTIKKRVGIKFGPVTLYRLLKKFEEIRLIHKVLDCKGTANYMLSLYDASQPVYQDHLHFNCTTCNTIFCLKGVTVPKLDLPADFETEYVGVTLVGICPDCNSGIIPDEPGMIQ